MLKKIVKIYVNREVEMVIDKAIGGIITEGYIDGGVLWLTISKLGKSGKKKGQIQTQMGTTLTVKELQVALNTITTTKIKSE